MFIQKSAVSSEFALQLLDQAKMKAEELGINVNIAVVDEGGHLLAFQRMDNAPLLSIDISINKAYTAAAFGIPTHEWYPILEKSPALKNGIVHTSRLVIFGGGLPIYHGDRLAGGIGISGGSEEEDRLCAEAALLACLNN